jgi:hypothetical protein
MAQAWHRQAIEKQFPRMTSWKAVGRPSGYKGLRALPSAQWMRVDPFASYRPPSRERQLEAGPHATFLQLRKLALADTDFRDFQRAVDLFANEYGLLGLFHHQYSAPILPDIKVVISPEAIVENGRLRRVDPATEGLELVAKAVNDSRYPSAPRFTKEDHVLVAMPDEVSFGTKNRFPYPDDPSGRPLWPGPPKRWEEVRAGFDALFVLDPARRTKASVLVQKESIISWGRELKYFPPPPYEQEQLPSLAWILGDWLADVSPIAELGEHGELRQNWRCNTLLQAMYLMLFLDLTGGSRLRECASHDCSNYYRLGPQSNSKYCSVKHANRASTRLQRGQEP